MTMRHDKKTEKPAKVRMTLDLSEAAFKRLQELHRLSEFESKADVIREALRVYEFLLKAALEGATIQSIAPHGGVTNIFISSLPTQEELEDALAPA